MTDLEVFRYADTRLRAVTLDGEPWFIAADVAYILGLDNVSQALSGLDDDEKSSITITDGTPGNPTRATINEPGLYSLILRSRRPEAREFKRWITHEVLPSIRKTGAYVAPVSEMDQIRALHAAVGALLAQNAVDAPKVAAWDELASASGDYEVGDAAKILARSGIETGRQRLFAQLHELGWIHRGSAGKWTAYQSAVDSGYLAEKPMKHYHPRTAEVILDPPQVRVTVKGLERLRVRLGELVLT